MVKKLLAIPRRLYWVTEEVFRHVPSSISLKNNTMPITDSTETFVAKTFGFLLITIGQLWTQNLQAKCLCWASNIWQSLYAKGLKLFSLFSSCLCVFHTSVVNPTRSFNIFPFGYPAKTAGITRSHSDFSNYLWVIVFIALGFLKETDLLTFILRTTYTVCFVLVAK